jgi:hypothetical protein
MRLVELVIEDEDIYGVDAISLVENPAIEENWIALKEERVEFKTMDEEKRILIGAALVPDKPIYRRKGEDEYYVYMSKSTIRQAAELYLMRQNQHEATFEHDEKIDGCCVVESWIVEGEHDKSQNFGMNLPQGTWMVSMKILNDVIWNDYVKTGKVKGFSIEGYFADKAQFAKAIVKSDKRTKSGKKIEMESYADYPEAVKNNAKKGIELNEKVNNRCSTQIGKVRAQQLASGEAISEETIKRMYSYLSRAQEYYDEGDTEACGTISYLLWGGLAGLRWSESKLKELEMLSAIEEVLQSNQD